MTDVIKPVRGLENLKLGEKYFRVTADGPKHMEMGEVFSVVRTPFVHEITRAVAKLGNEPEYHSVEVTYLHGKNYPRGYLEQLINVDTHFVVGDVPDNNDRFFAYTEQSFATLKDIVLRKAFDEYCVLIGPCVPARDWEKEAAEFFHGMTEKQIANFYGANDRWC